MVLMTGTMFISGCVSIPPLIQVEHKESNPDRRLDEIEKRLDRIEQKLDRKP